MEKTEAASVQLTTEPIKKLSGRDRFKMKWQQAHTNAAVMTTPKVESTAALPAVGLACSQFVEYPP